MGKSKKIRGLGLVASTMMVVGGSYAMLKGFTEDTVEGSFQTLGIDTRVESISQKEDNLVEGDKVEYILKTEVRDIEQSGVDAKVRHRVVLSDKDKGLIEEGKVRMLFDGEELGNKEEIVTGVSTVKVGEVKDSLIEIEVGDNLGGNVEPNFEMGIITEAVQDAYSTGEDFEDYSVVVAEDVIVGDKEVQSVESRK